MRSNTKFFGEGCHFPPSPDRFWPGWKAVGATPDCLRGKGVALQDFGPNGACGCKIFALEAPKTLTKVMF